MKLQSLQAAADLAGRTENIFVATADANGVPHLAAAGKLDASADRVRVSEWFCPGTMENLQRNRKVSIVVWDPQLDEGFQLLGEVERLEDVAVMDGYEPGQEQRPPIPQVQRRLDIRVVKVLDFSHAPHSDVEE